MARKERAMWFVAQALIRREVIQVEDLKWMMNLARLALVLVVRDMTMGVEDTL
jgi:hypothetical protein